MTISMLLLCGAIAGLILGSLIPRQRIGCFVLFVVPIAMVVYVSRWQAVHPENIRSTSGLDFIFVPLWPSLAALAGFYVARALRASIVRRRRDDS
ncbi:hypothetical protein AB2M62_01240 [Sphingomonas sp. MMS12-HWE2-04]|uniref:hypothetical protein n=1 Tax=Sphingomonas sp. MMS12-HWE2-04 TaxID=3234199 RepID=UPI00384BB160